jgi:hypothetical protein
MARESNAMTKKVPLPWTTQQPETPKPSGADLKDWIHLDQAAKESTPQQQSDGGKGVSN